nr:beta-ketoacyl synthase N-terminal-like domain-containing protein [Halomonas piscis]
MTARITDLNPNAVAIVGLVCRFGPIGSADALWEVMARGDTAVRAHTAQELIALGHDPATLRRPGFVSAGSVLKDADNFDAELFDYSPQHAEWLDPQQRLLLEVAWHALEDAGIAPRGTRLRTGVFMSVGQPTTPPVSITDLDAAGMIRFSSSDKDFAATRVSYKLGLTGPSLTVQTACSSSLVGTHLAVESLLDEECDAAIVGGVSLHLPQAGYVASRDMILSPSGGCRPFDDAADGTVFGNGVGVVVLRRLADALADGDPIRAVIRGSAVNNDGSRKMDFHAPSPEGQEAVLREALALGEIDPHTVGHVETHGTGTQLGDPVEFSALARVYGGADRTEHCLLGSIKNTVGHTNTAAGVAGLIKTVLMLEKGAVPPQHDFHRPNSRLPLDGSGLRVGTGSADWPVSKGPRRAAVSSFGIGGTNAHLVLEEAPVAAPPPEIPDAPRIVALSARTPESLREAARRLADALDTSPAPRLADVAATLSLGRSHERERLAVIADDIPTLVTRLRTGEAGSRGTAARRGSADDAPSGNDLEAIAARWANGEGALPEPPPGARRIRLPGYPFARQRWPRPPGHSAEPQRISAMLERNISTLGAVRFERTLFPEEEIVADHVVAGDPVLPAAAQLDMALAAAGEAFDRPVSGLGDVTFHQPVRVLAPTRLLAELTHGPSGATVRILSQADDGAPVLHTEAKILTDAEPALRDTTTDGHHEAVPVEDLYRRFDEHGVTYGPTFRVIRDLGRGERGALATVESSSRGQHSISPHVLDGVLQAVIGCLGDDDLGGETFIPFALGRIDVLGAVPSRVRVRVAPAALAGSGRRVRKFDISATTEDGRPVLQLLDLALRPVARAPVPARVHVYGAKSRPPGAAPRETPGPVVLVDGNDAQASALRAAWGVDTVLRDIEALPADLDRRPVVVWPLPPGDGAADARTHALAALSLLRTLLQRLPRRGARVLATYPTGSLAGPGLAAIGRSLTAENPRFELVAVELSRPEDMAPVAVSALASLPEDRHLRADGRTEILVPQPLPAVPASAPFRRGGRYWINGMGHLAEALCAHLLARYDAHVVLTGRSAPTGERGTALERLARRGGHVAYHPLDCTDPAAVRAFAAGTEPVHGVFHCAGVLRDAFILRKTPEDAAEVIAPKLIGAEALDEATADWPLDCFVLFSSVSGALGSPGQSDYAFANAAMDAFAQHRAHRRPGRTLSIAWPYWADGGMGSDTAASVIGSLGMEPLSTADGMATLETLLTAPDVPATPVVLCGDHERLHATLPLLQDGEETTEHEEDGMEAPDAGTNDTTAPAEQTPSDRDAPKPGISDERVRIEIARRVTAAVAEATRAPTEKVLPERHFEDLGIDSLLVVRIVELLEEDFGPLSKTLLFECQTVAELVDYFLSEHAERCLDLAGPAAPEPAAPAVPAETKETPAAPAQPDTGPTERRDAGSSGVDPHAIAIIGMAGRYPEGEELDAFWQMLLAGKDCIVEVPRERWDAEAMYDPDPKRVDRTYTKWGSFLNGVETFDAPLFNISPREASITDPQARLFLESCWAVLEDAGYRPNGLIRSDDPAERRDVGVFAGVMYGEYQLHEAEERMRGNPILANSAYWSIANRVSYFFDFQGPSVAVDTACSSALTAVHLACEALRAGSCRVAIAGGVNVLIHPNKYFMLGQGRFAASDGRCRSFGAGGDGYVPGEGVGSVLLKPLTEAIADGDPIHGVIRGTAANHGGRTNGYTVPNPKAQANLITKALRDASLEPSAIDYVEAHGTGTSLGDPIEIRGLTAAFTKGGQNAPGPVPIGSVKSNLGHLESAAGVVALHKVLLQLRHRTLVPSIHATPPNPEIDFAASPFVVQQQTAPWTSRDGGPLRAGISSFGAGGANSHIVVEQAPERAPRSGDAEGPVVLFLSARTNTALAAYAETLRAHVHSERPALADVAYTFAVGRVDLPKRRAIPAATLDELIAKLETVARGGRLEVTTEAAEWEAGGAIDREAACGAAGRGRRIALPHYPFERVRCWYDLQITHLDRNRLADDAPALGHFRDFGKAPEPTHAPAPITLRTPAARPDRVPNDTPGREPMPRDHKIRLRPLAMAEASDGAQPPADTPSPMPIEPTTPAAPSTPTAPPERPMAPARAEAHRTEAELTEMLASVLYLSPDEVAPRQPFHDLGVDSILGVEFVNTVNGRYGLDIKATTLYDHPTLAAFAAHVAEMLGGGSTAAPGTAPPATPTPRAAPAAQATATAPAETPADPDRYSEVRDTLRAQLADVLYSAVEDIDEDQSFNDLGLDSILSVEFVTFVNRAYGLDIKATTLYDHPALATFARHVAGMLSPQAPPPQPPTAATTATTAPADPMRQSDVDTVLSAVKEQKLSVDHALSLLETISSKE